MCRARRESGALIYLLGSHNCARVTHFTSAFHFHVAIYFVGSEKVHFPHDSSTVEVAYKS